MTKFQIFALLTKNGTAYFTHHGKRYILLSVERESGCGSSFNLRVMDDNRNVSYIYVKTVD